VLSWKSQRKADKSAQETARQEKEDALARLVAAREASASGLRTSQSASSEVDRLRNDL
jgi:hypothetical protein